MSQDTYSGNAYEPWTQHLYSYCGNNPTNFIDPTGHFWYYGNTQQSSSTSFKEAKVTEEKAKERKKQKKIFEAVKDSELGDDITGDYSDWTYEDKLVAPGVYETIMRHTEKDGKAFESTSYTIISGGYDDMYNYAKDINTKNQIAGVVIGAIIAIGSWAIAAPVFALAAKTAFAIGGAGTALGMGLSVHSALKPGPGERYQDNLHDNPNHQEYIYVNSKTTVSINGWGSTTHTMNSDGSGYYYSR